MPFLGEVPLNMTLRETSDAGRPVVAVDPDGPHARLYKDIARQVWEALSGGARRPVGAADRDGVGAHLRAHRERHPSSSAEGGASPAGEEDPGAPSCVALGPLPRPSGPPETTALTSARYGTSAPERRNVHRPEER